ncbi:MAG TPA: DNA-directed DNA polymerase II small subunit [Nitrososphaera sp.]|nr:DNA-directed DNA polymerase II small subunit [Nitrososphaera sp.]
MPSESTGALPELALHSELSNALSYATNNRFQIHPDAFAMLKGLDDDIMRIVQDIVKAKKNGKNFVILVEDIKGLLSPSRPSEPEPGSAEACSVLMDPTPKVTTAEGVEGYAALFRSRFEKTMKILAQRPDSKRISKVASVKSSRSGSKPQQERGERSLTGGSTTVIAGLLMSRRTRKNGIELAVDDYTGTLEVMAISEEVKRQAAFLALDQMVMLELESGAKGAPGQVVKSIVAPDIPDHLPGRSRSESYAVLISDMHVGSKYFMAAEFARFLEWLSSTDDDIVRKIKFLCFGGDLVDGIGIFPNQDKELLDMNVAGQMARASELLSKVPRHIKMFVIPGNHDPGRRALPQPSIPVAAAAEKLYSLENCTMLGNPAFVELNGVKVLMYHGQSLDDVIATTPGLSYSKPAEAMKVFLKARHLSPTYGERTPIAPEQEDMMVISEVPDILHSGHVHVVDIQNYRGTLIVNSGAWQAQTKFQQTMGIMPSPGIAVLVNLATLQPFLQDFTR